MDSKAIEEKAINCLKLFVEDSKVISPFISDKENMLKAFCEVVFWEEIFYSVNC